MKLVFTAVVAIAFGAGSTLFAQDMIEYSNAAGKPPVGLQGLSSKINSAMRKRPLVLRKLEPNPACKR